MKSLSFLLLIFYAQLSAQSPATIPRAIKSLVEIFSPAKQATQNAIKGIPNGINGATSGRPYSGNLGNTNFTQNTSMFPTSTASNTTDINQLMASWDDETVKINRRIYGTNRPSIESNKLYKENRNALKVLNDEFDVNITIENQIKLNNTANVILMQSNHWKEIKILEEIVWLQKANGFAANDYSEFSDRNVRKITSEGVKLLKPTLAQIRSNISLYESIVSVTGKPSVLKNTELITDQKQFEAYYLVPVEKAEYFGAADFILTYIPSRSEVTKPKRKIIIDLKGISFSKMMSSIQAEIKHEIEAMSNIEMSLIELGFIEFDFSKIAINNDVELQNEFRYLRDRLDRGITDFKVAYNIETNENLTYEAIEGRVKQETDALFSMLRASIHNEEEMSNLELLEFYRKAKNSSSETPAFFDNGLRESIYSDKNAKIYYIKGADGIETFQKETSEIKVEGKETVSKEVIKLVANTNLYTEIEPELTSKVEAIRNNLDKKIEKENTHILFFTKFKNQKETKGDDTIDSLQRMFSKEHISFIYNKSDIQVRRQLKRAYRKNKNKTIFNISHIDNGALMSTENTNYVLPIEELNTFSKKYNVNEYLAGCNGAYYENTGTTDLINMLGFATAIGEGIQDASSHGEFMSSISTNKVIKGKTGEVKLLLDETTFSNGQGTSAAILKKEEQFWRYLTRLFLQKTN